MIRYKGVAWPSPTPGEKRKGKKEVVPDQSLSLKEILRRFVRNEALPVGHKAVYGSDGEIDPESDSQFNIDQEKAKHWDLTEKDEFREEVMKIREEHIKAEKQAKAKKDKEAAEKAEKDFARKVRLAAKKYAKKYPGEAGSI